jgi:hypothetical protein
MKDKDLDGALKNVIGSLIDNAKKETSEKHSDIIKALKDLGMEHFDLFVRFQLEQCIDNFHKSDKGSFIYCHYGYVESAFNKLMEHKEGGACSVDKGRHITRGLYKHFEEGKDVNFERTKKEQFWKTSTLTTKKCFDFFNAIHSAYYGNHIKLFEFYRDLTTPNN